MVDYSVKFEIIADERTQIAGMVLCRSQLTWLWGALVNLFTQLSANLLIHCPQLVILLMFYLHCPSNL